MSRKVIKAHLIRAPISAYSLICYSSPCPMNVPRQNKQSYGVTLSSKFQVETKQGAEKLSLKAIFTLCSFLSPFSFLTSHIIEVFSGDVVICSSLLYVSHEYLFFVVVVVFYKCLGFRKRPKRCCTVTLPIFCKPSNLKK